MMTKPKSASMFSARRFVGVRSPTSRDLGVGVAALETLRWARPICRQSCGAALGDND